MMLYGCLQNSGRWESLKRDDAGTSVFAKVHITTSHLQKYKAAGKTEEEYEPNAPLEVKAEQKLIPFFSADKEISIDIRLQMGKFWLKTLKENSLDYVKEFIKDHTFLFPPNSKDTDYIYAHREVWQQYSAISGRCMDGYEFYQYISKAGQKASDSIPSASYAEKVFY